MSESVVQASIVIITTAAGKLQDESPTNSLDHAVIVWLVYAFASVAVSGALLFVAYAAPTWLPAARLSQVPPRRLAVEVDRLCEMKGIAYTKATDDDDDTKDTMAKEKILKAPHPGQESLRWLFLVGSLGVILIGWIMFGMGVAWGVHGSVIAGTTGE